MCLLQCTSLYLRWGEVCLCNKGFVEAFGGTLFNFMLFGIGIFSRLLPYPFLNLQAFIAIHSIMLAIGSMSLGKLACGIRV